MSKVYYKVAKHLKGVEQKQEPELFIVEDAELSHFLHEQDSSHCVLIVDEIPARNLYLLANNED